MTKTAGISKGMAKWIEDFVVGLNKKAENEQIDTNTTPTETQTVEQTTPCDPSADPSTAEYFNGNKIASINVNDLPKVVWNDETFYVLFNEDNGSATILNKFTNVVTTVRASNIEEVDEALNSLQVVTSNNDNLNLKTAKEISEELMEEVDVVNDDELNIIDQQTIEEENNIINNDQSEIINQMQSQINSLTEQIEILKQQYARTEELTNLDMGVEELEVQHFNETANETAQQIQEDNNKDITTPKGRTSLREQLLNDINNIVGDDISESYTDVETNDIENDEAEPIKLETPSVINEQMYMENTEEQDNKLDDFSEEDEEDEEDDFEILDEEESEVFKQAVCPNCGGELVKANSAGSFQGIICQGSCKSEYAVNLDDETIFRKRGVN